MESSGFLFVELEEGRPVEVLRVGEFVDRNGRPVKIVDEDLDEFVANFEANAAGQEVPIDVNHERGEAAGWVRSLTRAGSTLVAVPDWNEVGVRMVGERIYRYLSATIDLAKKVIKSISLVNFPAVKGLRPVELAEGVYGLEGIGLLERVITAVVGVFSSENSEDVVEFIIRKEENEIVLYSSDGKKVLGRFPFGPDEKYKTEEEAREAAKKREKQIEYFKHREGGEPETEMDQAEFQEGVRNESIVEEGKEMTDQEMAELREKIRAELEAEMEEEQMTRAELLEQVRAEVEAEMAERYEKRQALVEFAEEVCSGEVGLSVKPDDVVAVLEAVDDGQVEMLKVMLRSKVVDFREQGSAREGQGDRKRLEGPYAVQLRAWREAGQTTAEFFELNQDVLGEADEYDLSEFEEED